jgi:hypothetical protein
MPMAPESYEIEGGCGYLGEAFAGSFFVRRATGQPRFDRFQAHLRLPP